MYYICCMEKDEKKDSCGELDVVKQLTLIRLSEEMFRDNEVEFTEEMYIALNKAWEMSSSKEPLFDFMK